MVDLSPSGIHTVSTVFPSREPQQVAARSVGRIEVALDGRQAQRVLACKLRPQRLGQIGDAIKFGDPAPVNRIVDLLRAKLRLVRAKHHAKERLESLNSSL